jgi:NAD(P)-dependent dehydrogenase (short-subunit alcohol dehydrogenase family)
LRGPFLCAKHALLRLVRRGGGVIINVSSHGAFQASPTGIVDYAGRRGKGGLVTLTYFGDVVRPAVFLASDEARWITGAVLRVDGGIVVP